MTISLGDAILHLKTDDRGLDDGLGRAESRTRGWAGKLGGIAKAGFMAAVVGIGVAAAATSAILVKSVQEAADAEETYNKMQVTFGENTRHLDQDLSNFADRVNRSRFELREMATDFGAVVKGMGGTDLEASQLSGSLSMLAVDVASFMNAQDSDVMDAFRRAITGEFESLKQYGIVINQAAVQQELLNQGIDESWNVITPMQKAHAIYQLMLRGTVDAQGDAERTSGSFTNQMRGFKAVIQDTYTEIGMNLLPVLTPLLQRFGDLARDVLPKVVTAFDNFLGPIFERVNRFFMLVDQFGLDSGAVEAFFRGMIPPELQGIFDKLITLGGQIRDDVVPMFDRLKLKIEQMAELAAPVVIKQLEEILDGLSEWWMSEGGESFRALTETTIELLAATAFGSIEVFLGLVNALVRLMNNDPSGAMMAIKDALRGLMDAALAVVDTDFDEFMDVWRGNAEMLELILNTVGEILEGKVRDGINKVKSAFEGLKGIVEDLKDLWEKMVPPAWLPGSPPPIAFAVGDVKDQMKSLNAELSGTAAGFQGQGQTVYDYSQKVTNIGPMNMENQDIVDAFMKRVGRL